MQRVNDLGGPLAGSLSRQYFALPCLRQWKAASWKSACMFSSDNTRAVLRFFNLCKKLSSCTLLSFIFSHSVVRLRPISFFEAWVREFWSRFVASKREEIEFSIFSASLITKPVVSSLRGRSGFSPRTNFHGCQLLETFFPMHLIFTNSKLLAAKSLMSFSH